MGYIGQAPTKVPLTSADITDGTIALADMASQSVDEDNLYISNSGSNGNFLSKQSGDAGGLTWAAAGGAWKLIGTEEATSAVASLTITGLSSTYDTYAIVGSDLVPATDGQAAWLRVGDSGGVDSGTDYAYHRSTLTGASASSFAGSDSTGDSAIKFSGGVGSAAGEGVHFTFFINRPGDGTTQPLLQGTYIINGQSTTFAGGTVFGQRTAVITLDRIQFLFGSGDVASGRLSVFGIAHT